MRPTTVLTLLLATVAACSRSESRLVSAPAATPSRATLTYLGVAGWMLANDAGTLLFDPYVTRAPAADDAEPLVSDTAAVAAYTPDHADVVLVGHSHFDHVLDVPAIARRTGATVVGTDSTANVARAGDVSSEHIVVARGGDVFQLGPFQVRAVAALHSLTGQKNEPIPPGLRLPLPPRAYGEGGTLQYLVRFDGRSIFFVGTANFIEENVRGLRPDVAVIAVGLREKVPDYTCRLLRALGLPPLVLPNHFDEFRAPLHPGHTDLSAETRADLAAFAEEVHTCAPSTRVHVPTPLLAIPLERGAPRSTRPGSATP